LRLDLAALDEARAGGSLDDTASRLVLCLLLAASAGMPRGGIVRAHLAREGMVPHGIVMEIGGERAAWPAALAGDPAQPDSPSRALAAPLARMLANSIGWRLELHGDVLNAWPA